MPIGTKAFDEINEADIAELVSGGVPEGLMLEYKREPYAATTEAKKEFLKDISALANSSGGHLIIGLPEVEGIPSQPTPFMGDADEELRRMENLARDGLEPRIQGLRIKAVPMAAGGNSLVIRIPKSPNAPHRVIFQNSNRFFARHSASSAELDVEELRTIFNVSATWTERAARFRSERLARIETGELLGPIDRGEGTLVLHLIPVSAFSGVTIDVDRAKSRAETFAPIRAEGLRPRLNFDGFIALSQNETSYTQVFRNGILEAVATHVTDTHNGRVFLSVSYIERLVLEVVGRYSDGLSGLDVAMSFTVAVSLLGVGGTVGIMRETFNSGSGGVVSHDRLELPAVIVDARPENEANWRRVMRPSIDALANAAGMSRASFFDPDGNWIGQ